jgi:hypothetical protein
MYYFIKLLSIFIIFGLVQCQTKCQFSKQDIDNAFKILQEIDPVKPNKGVSPVQCTVDCTGYLTTKDDYNRCSKVYNKETTSCNRKLCDITMTMRRNVCQNSCNYINQGDSCPKNNYGECLSCSCKNQCIPKKDC